MLRAVLVLVALAVPAVPAIATAQPGAVPPAPTRPARIETVAPEKYDPSTALALSLGTTVVGYGAIAIGAERNLDGVVTLGSLGAFLGPSVGHWYSGHVLTRGLGLRALGLVGSTTGMVMIFASCPPFHGHDCESSPGGGILLVAGAITYVVGTIDDIATAPGEARRRNAAAARISVAPIIAPHQTGLAVLGTF